MQIVSIDIINQLTIKQDVCGGGAGISSWRNDCDPLRLPGPPGRGLKFWAKETLAGTKVLSVVIAGFWSRCTFAHSGLVWPVILVERSTLTGGHKKHQGNHMTVPAGSKKLSLNLRRTSLMGGICHDSTRSFYALCMNCVAGLQHRRLCCWL